MDDVNDEIGYYDKELGQFSLDSAELPSGSYTDFGFVGKIVPYPVQALVNLQATGSSLQFAYEEPTAKPGVSIQRYEYRFYRFGRTAPTTWTNNGLNRTLTQTSLSPNTLYVLEVRPVSAEGAGPLQRVYVTTAP